MKFFGYLALPIFVIELGAIGSQARYEANDESRTWVNERPVIGVYTEPTNKHPNKHHYIAASYVKWLESVGARSIPIPFNADNSTIDSIFDQINGILFTGGRSLTLPESLRRLWELAVAENDAGGIFPIWGTCLGFERLVSLVSQEGFSIFSGHYDSENLNLALDFYHPESNFESILFHEPDIKNTAANQPVANNMHIKGIPPSTFLVNEFLTSTFRIISTNKDRNGIEFVSSIEARDYPFYAVQWHPEKNNFEYGSTVKNGQDIPNHVINHSEDAIKVSIEMASIFVHMARKNDHVYTGEFPLVSDHKIMKGKKDGHPFDQIYVIDVSKWNHKSTRHSSYEISVFVLGVIVLGVVTMLIMRRFKNRSNRQKYSQLP